MLMQNEAAHQRHYDVAKRCRRQNERQVSPRKSPSGSSRKIRAAGQCRAESMAASAQKPASTTGAAKPRRHDACRASGTCRPAMRTARLRSGQASAGVSKVCAIVSYKRETRRGAVSLSFPRRCHSDRSAAEWRNLPYAKTLTFAGSEGFAAFCRLVSFTSLLRCDRSFRKLFDSWYSRPRSRFTIAFDTTRHAALGRK